ncbi:MAG TPA: transcriptional regulator [Proteobacteria bacterium]|nr:transcriptional regulator [Pseudomonadota bacterium]
MERDQICCRVAEVLKVLGHPVRLQIVQTLLTQESCVKNLWHCLELSQATVSQHLSVLKGKGIVDSAREGVAMRYWVSDEISKLLIGTLMEHFGMDCRQAVSGSCGEEFQDAAL